MNKWDFLIDFLGISFLNFAFSFVNRWKWGNVKMVR